MLVMMSNDSGMEIGYLAGRYHGFAGHLYGPGAQRGPFKYLPYGLDNNAYSMWERNLDWEIEMRTPWLELLDWAATASVKPLWAAVPDVVTDRERTIERWGKYVGEVRSRGFRPAFCVQDGMTFADVPDDGCMLFIGGSTLWKENAIEPWCAEFPGRVHVARVTERKRLLKCYRAGAASVDGNGWWRQSNKPGSRAQRDDLVEFFESIATGRAA